MYLQNSTSTNSLSVTALLKFDFVKTRTPSSVLISSEYTDVTTRVTAQSINLISILIKT